MATKFTIPTRNAGSGDDMTIDAEKFSKSRLKQTKKKREINKEKEDDWF